MIYVRLLVGFVLSCLPVTIGLRIGSRLLLELAQSKQGVNRESVFPAQMSIIGGIIIGMVCFGIFFLPVLIEWRDGRSKKRPS